MILDLTTVMEMPNDSYAHLPNNSRLGNRILDDSFHGNNSNQTDVPYWDMPTTIFLSTLMIIFMVFAIVGNFLVIIVIARHRGMRTRTNMFLCNLAIADFLCAVLCMPVSLTTMIKGQWIFGSTNGLFCTFNGFLMPLFFVTSIHTLMYISIHKYISITRPFSRVITYRRIQVMIGLAWFWAFVTGYVTVHGLNTVRYKPFTTQCGPEYPTNFRTYMHPVHVTLTCYIIPFAIIIICYALMFREIRAHGVRLELHSNKEKQAIFIQQRRITFTLFMVLIVFVISWTPYILYSLYVSVLKDKSRAHSVVNAVSYWFGYMNSACNPIIYALRSPAFRDGYMEILCRTRAVIVSEETEPWVSSPGPLGKLKSYIKRSTMSHSQRSQDQSTDSQNGGFNSLLSARSKTLSTNSLPEAVKYRPTVNISGAKVTKIGGNQVITIGGKIVYFKEAKYSKNRSKGDSTTSEEQLSSSGPRSIIKKSTVDPGLRVSFHDTTLGGELAPVIEGESISQESSSTGNNLNNKGAKGGVDSAGNSTGSDAVNGGAKTGASNVVTLKSANLVPNPKDDYLSPSPSANERFTPSTDESIQTEDDSVFASIGSDSPPVAQIAPRIKITSENNDVFYIESEADSEDIDRLETKKSREYYRSVSEQPKAADDENVNTNANSVPRSTSDNCLTQNESQNAKSRSRVSKTHSFFRWFNRRRARSPKSSPESSRSSEDGSRKFLAFPRRSHPRSYSDGGDESKRNNSLFSDSENLTKVRSDTLIYDNESNPKKHWFFKLGNKQAKSDSHMLDEQNQMHNKPKLQNYPSVERLDRIPSKRQKSKRRKKKQLQRNLNNTEESWLEESTMIDMEDSTYSSSGLLNRSLSDPCISIQDLEDKVQFKEDIKKQRSFRRGKKTSSTCNPDVQSIYLILDNFENLRSSDV